MTRYAKETEVPVEKTRAEIESMVRRYGADGFVSGWQGERAQVAFSIKGRQVRMEIRLPHPSDKRFQLDGNRKQRSSEAVGRAWEQACRSTWRVLLLLVRAKLEAVEMGVTTFDEEFLANLVIPDGSGETVGARVLDDMKKLGPGFLPPLLPPS